MSFDFGIVRVRERASRISPRTFIECHVWFRSPRAHAIISGGGLHWQSVRRKKNERARRSGR